MESQEKKFPIFANCEQLPFYKKTSNNPKLKKMLLVPVTGFRRHVKKGYKVLRERGLPLYVVTILGATIALVIINTHISSG